jgi:plastocyanin
MSGLSWRVKMAPVLVAVVTGPLAPLSASAATQPVVLAGLRFSPAHLEIALGDTVDWVAGDDDGHTVTARDGTFDSSPRGLMSEGDEFRYRFRVPGTFAYYCRVHGSKGMQGEIVVIDPSAPTTTTTRLTPVTAAATTTSTAATTTSAAPETTTTSRPLATSSTTSLSQATATTVLPGTPAVPQEAVAMNPNARVVGSPIPSADLPESQAAARRPGGSGSGSVPAAAAVGAGLVALLGAGGLAARRRRRRSA